MLLFCAICIFTQPSPEMYNQAETVVGGTACCIKHATSCRGALFNKAVQEELEKVRLGEVTQDHLSALSTRPTNNITYIHSPRNE